jgi:hypothetical protein
MTFTRSQRDMFISKEIGVRKGRRQLRSLSRKGMGWGG